MSLVAFETLPDEARLWIFGADRELEEGEASLLGRRLAPFLEEWTAHRRDLRVGFDLRHRRFLLVAVDESAAPASGCSIDALVREVRSLERELSVRLLDAAQVWFRDAAGAVRRAGRGEFRELAARGEVGETTIVFDLTLGRVGDLRRGRWELPAAESWHGRLLERGVAGTAPD